MLLVGSVFSYQRNTEESSIQGLGSSIGSSRIIEVQDSIYTVYDYTSMSCSLVRTESLSGLDSTVFLFVRRYLVYGGWCLDLSIPEDG